MTDTLQIITLISIWLSIIFSLITLFGAISFWLKHSHQIAQIVPLKRTPLVSIVVPAHNEEVVITQTTEALLNLNYPAEKIEILIYADNCQDQTAIKVRKLLAQNKYQTRNAKVIERTGTGGKAGVLNDALKVINGEYMCVYDADAMPEENALYFLMKKVIENPNLYMGAFGRNKTRNARQNLLTKFINQETTVSQRIQHCGVWHLFKIGRIPGTNFIVKTSYLKKIGGWANGALTEDTDLSFKIMSKGKLIALAYNSEAFQQEPEHLKDYYFQRLRWAKGNYEVVLHNFRHLFDKSNWRIKIATMYYTCTFFWFNTAVILSDIIFLINLIALIARYFDPQIITPFQFTQGNLLLAKILFFNWLLMIMIYILQIFTADATQFGQATSEQLWLAVLSYFTYSQLFIVISAQAVLTVFMDKIFHRQSTKWVKTKRFDD